MKKIIDRKIKTKSNELGILIRKGKKNSRVKIESESDEKLIPSDSFEFISEKEESTNF